MSDHGPGKARQVICGGPPVGLPQLRPDHAFCTVEIKTLDGHDDRNVRQLALVREFLAQPLVADDLRGTADAQRLALPWHEAAVTESIRHGEHLLIANTAQEQIDAIRKLIRDPAQAAQLAANALRHVQEHGSWDAVAEYFLAQCCRGLPHNEPQAAGELA